MALTRKQQAFVDAYTGNGTAAAKAAGYKGNDATLAQVASENLKKPEVLAAIQVRNQVPSQVRAAVAQAGTIATRAERQAFWTRVMLDAGQKMADRLKAAELLGKSEADFVERVQHSGSLTLAQLIEQASASPAPEESAPTKPVEPRPEDSLVTTQPPEGP